MWSEQESILLQFRLRRLKGGKRERDREESRVLLELKQDEISEYAVIAKGPSDSLFKTTRSPAFTLNSPSSSAVKE